MKKRICSFVVFTILICMMAGCGGKATSQQEPKPAQEKEQEKDQDQQKPAQETDQPDSNQDASDVKHWKIKKGQLLGQTGPEAEDFIVFASLPTDSGIRDYAKVVSVSNNEMFLINQDAAFYRFDVKSNQATLINSGAYDALYDAYKDAVFFIKTDGSEYVVDWKTGNITETNNFRQSYNVVPNSYQIDGFNEFAEIQDAIKNGNYKAAFDKGYIVEANGDIYDFKNSYITNVHLPKAYAGNTYAAGDCTAFIKDGKLNVYRFGEELATIDLPEGGFVVADIFYSMNGNSVTEASALLFNFDDRCMYKAEGGSVNKIFDNVKDYFAPKDGQVFWVDGDNSGHVCHWKFDQNYVTIEHVIGVSHYRDFPGFVVDEDEDQGVEFNGLYILLF